VWVTETEETLDYIKGSKRTHKVRSFSEIRTMTHTYCFLAPRLTWALEYKRPLGRPLCLCRYRVFQSREAQPRKGQEGVGSSLESTGKQVNRQEQFEMENFKEATTPMSTNCYLDLYEKRTTMCWRWLLPVQDMCLMKLFV